MLGFLLSLALFLPSGDELPSFPNSVTTMELGEAKQPHILTTTWEDSAMNVVHTVQTDCSKVPTAEQCARIHVIMVKELQRAFPPRKK